MSFTPAEVFEGVQRVRTILETGILGAENVTHPLFRSAFLEVIVYVRDLLEKCKKRNRRINFTEDVVATQDCRDVTDLITDIRDAACHIDSWKRSIAGTGLRSAANIIIGCGTVSFEGNPVSSDYHDDICFIYGARKLYLKRHVVRAFNEALKVLSEDPDVAFMIGSL